MHRCLFALGYQTSFFKSRGTASVFIARCDKSDREEEERLCVEEEGHVCVKEEGRVCVKKECGVLTEEINQLQVEVYSFNQERNRLNGIATDAMRRAVHSPRKIGVYGDGDSGDCRKEDTRFRTRTIS